MKIKNPKSDELYKFFLEGKSNIKTLELDDDE